MNLKDRLYYIYSIRWVQHLSFWTVFLILELGRFWDMEPERLPGEVIFESIQISFIAALVYFNLRYLIPKYWNKGQYLKYVGNILLWELITIAILSFIVYYFPEIGFKKLAQASAPKIFLFNAFKTNIFVLSSSLFHFVKDWINLKDENLKFTAKAQEQLEAELHLLKGQVNPHFLFNTLNNIYSMSLHDSVKTPEMILKLSQLLSYMIYECKDEEVSLEKEIQFIKNYIELESIRVEDVAKVNMKIVGEDPGHRIPPLLFIPLIENAFKHGISTELETSEIYINLAISNNSIELKIENPIDSKNDTDSNVKHNGLGIENVKKRLNLLFPENHIFEITENSDLYTTRLSLSL